jgi:hypothetical protein
MRKLFTGKDHHCSDEAATLQKASHLKISKKRVTFTLSARFPAIFHQIIAQPVTHHQSNPLKSRNINDCSISGEHNASQFTCLTSRSNLSNHSSRTAS